MLVIVIGLTLGVLALDQIHVDSKVITAPGSVLEIESVVMVEGAEFFASDGEIRLTTVSTNLDPTVLELIAAWFDDSVRIHDREALLGDRSAEENRSLGRAQMSQSLDIAIRVALERLGHDVITEAGALVAQVQAGTPAADAVTTGDVVIEALGESIRTGTQLVAAVQSLRPGDLFDFVVLEVDGSTRDESIVLADRDGKAFMGIAISTFVEMQDLPFSVDVDSRRIGGPSAGLALTLTVLDVLTEGELTGGLQVAATGTIDPLGGVGPIGGIEQKTHAVIRSGVDLFLVPSNEAEAARAIAGERVEVVAVDDLDDALEALVQRGGNGSGYISASS